MTQRYAKNTSVPVSRSEAQLKELLRRYGADAIMTYEERAQKIAAVVFRVNGRNVRLSLPLPDPTHADFTQKRTSAGRMKERSADEAHRKWEQACRARWRLLVMLVQAKLEAIEASISTFEREFLADIMLPDGDTFAQAVASGRADKILGPADGSIPLLPAAGAGR